MLCMAVKQLIMTLLQQVMVLKTVDILQKTIAENAKCLVVIGGHSSF